MVPIERRQIRPADSAQQEDYQTQTFVVQFDLKTFGRWAGLTRNRIRTTAEDDGAVWMARDRDHYAALLDDDGEKAKAALAALCLNGDDAAVVTAVALYTARL